jgi:hypothetical protein
MFKFTITLSKRLIIFMEINSLVWNLLYLELCFLWLIHHWQCRCQIIHYHLFVHSNQLVKYRRTNHYANKSFHLIAWLNGFLHYFMCIHTKFLLKDHQVPLCKRKCFNLIRKLGSISYFLIQYILLTQVAVPLK